MHKLNHLFILATLLCTQAFAVPTVINFQANIRKPDSSRLESPDVSYRFKYLNASGTCTIYVEEFNNISMVGSSGNISLKMGTGTKVFPPAAVTLYETFNNSLTNTMDCNEGGTYAPLSSDEKRNLNIEFTYAGSGGVQALNGIEINSVPYALHANEAEDAQKLGGFAAALFTKFSDFTTCTGGQVLTYNGTSFSCVSPGAAATFTGVLAGDVSGTQSATVVDTVGGKTATQISTSVDDTLNATSSATASRIVKRDGSGNASFMTAQATNFSGRHLVLFEPTDTNKVTVQAPTTFTGGDYTLTLPESKGLTGQVLSTDGNGVTTWIAASTGSVTNVSAGAPLLSSGGATPNITMPAATAAVDGYLSAANFTLFNSKQASGNYITALTGDVTATGPGSAAATISANAVTTAKINNLAVTDAKINDVAFTKITGKPTTLAGYGITDAVTNVTTGAPLVSSGGTTPNITMPAATAAVDGYLAAADFTTFNNKVSSQWTNNAANIYFNTGNVGIGTSTPTRKLDVDGRVNFESASAQVFNVVGKGTSYSSAVTGVATIYSENTSDSGGNVLKVSSAFAPNGFVVKDSGKVGIGLNSPVYTLDVNGDINVPAGSHFKINGVNIASGTVTNVGATAPLLSSGGATPTISMPAATAAVDGYLSATDFTTFNNKQTAGNYITALTGDVTAAGPGSAAATIANNAITTAKINNLAVTDAKINDVAFSKITGKPTTVAGYGITDAGTVTNIVTGTGLTGGPIATTGTISLASTAVTPGTYGSASAVPSFTVDAQGRLTAAGSSAYQDATGVSKGILSVGTNLQVSGGVISLQNASTSNTGALTNTDWNNFNNKVSSQWSNNSADIYFNTGKVGIGTNGPASPLHVVATNQAPGSNNDGNIYVQTSNAQGIDLGGSLGFGGLDGGGSDRVFATAAGRKENATSGNYAGYFAIETRPHGGSLAEGLRITSIGRVGLGLTDPQYKLDVNGDINIPAGSNFKINGTNVGLGTVTGTGTINTVPKFTAAGAIGNSNITDNGTVIALATDATVNGLKLGRGAGAVATNTAFGVSTLQSNTIGTNNVAIGHSAMTSNVDGHYNVAVGINAMNANTSGSSNSAYGTNSLTLNTSGGNNTGIGANALRGNLTGNDNSAFGGTALYANTTGASNVAAGFGALRANTTGGSNSATGTYALFVNSTGSNNVANGQQALYNTTGNNNTGIGSNALQANTTGVNNAALGKDSGNAITTGSYNVVIGSNTGSTIATTNNNIIISDGGGIIRQQFDSSGLAGIGMAPTTYRLSVNGDINLPAGSNFKINGTNVGLGTVTGTGTTGTIPKFTAAGAIGDSNITDSGTTVTVSTQAMINGIKIGRGASSVASNTALGANALDANTSGNQNLAVGVESMRLNTTGSNNAAVGFNTLKNNDTGSSNTAVGSESLRTNTTGNGNSTLGAFALFANTTGSNNISLGFSTMQTNTSGSYNVATGPFALFSNTSGNNNIVTGGLAMRFNTTGSDNVATGYQALYTNTTGVSNIAIGSSTMYANTTGMNNTATGTYSLNANTTGNSNTAAGNTSMQFNTTGGSNTAFGAASLYANSTGSNNTALGFSALGNLASGSNNLALGYTAGNSIASGSNNVVIGSNSGNTITGTSNNIIISDGMGNIRLQVNSSGYVGMGVVPTQALDVSGNIKTSGCLYYNSGSLGTCASDERLKENVHAFNLGLDTLLEIHPVNFTYNGKAGLKFNGQEQIGVIAQDLEKAAPSLVKRQMVQMNPEDLEKTEIKVVDYGAFTYVVINSIKDLYRKWFADSTVLHREIASVKQENVQLKNENQKMKNENEQIKARLDKIEKMLNSK